LKSSSEVKLGLGPVEGAREAGVDLDIDPVGLSKLAGGFHRNLLSEGDSPTIIYNMG